MKLEVGKYYINRNSRLVKITNLDMSNKYWPYEESAADGGIPWAYTKEGYYSDIGEKSEYDLIYEVTKEINPEYFL